MKYGFVNHNGLSVDENATVARVNPKAFRDCIKNPESIQYCADWKEADIIFSHISPSGNEWDTFIKPHLSGKKICIFISNENFLFPKTEYVSKNNAEIINILLINQRLINGASPKPNAVNALLRLTFEDAKYISAAIYCNQRVVFSVKNAVAGKHSVHSDPADYEWLNLLFNKPADSDTLVGWYMLAQAHALCEIVKQKNGLRGDKSAWRINDSWKDADGDQAAKLIANDFDYMVGSWGLKLAEKEKNDINLKLQEFARIVYGDVQSEIAEKDVDDVLEALKKIFAPAGGRKK